MKIPGMKLKNILAALMFIAVIACDNDTSGGDTGSAKADTSQANWPAPGDILGGDSIPSPQTQSDSNGTTQKK